MSLLLPLELTAFGSSPLYRAQYPDGSIPPSSGATIVGGVLTINGSGYGTKTVAAPKKYSDFEGMTNGNLLASEDPDWVGYNTNDGGVITNADSYSGSLSVHNRIGTAHPGGGRGEFQTNFFKFSSSAGAPVQTIYKHKLTGTNDSAGSPYGVRKYQRIGSIDGGGGGAYNGSMAVAFSDNKMIATQASDSGAIGWNDPAAGWISNPSNTYNGYTNFVGADLDDNWLTIRMLIVPNSSIGVADGLMQLEIWHPANGYAKWDNPTYEQIDTAGTFYNDSALLGLMVANVDTGGDNDYCTVYEDCVYVDNSLATVFITNTPTLDSSTPIICEVQIPTSWSDSQLILDFQQGRLLSGTNYVHVINSADTLVETGMEVVVP